MLEQDVIVIGGGPAGYTAAVRAARLGARVTVVEKRDLGGACLNRACIPTKFLRQAVEIAHGTREAGRYGLKASAASIDIAELRSRKENLISGLRTGIQDLMTENHIEVITGTARIVSSGTVLVTVNGNGQEKVLHAGAVILATGSRARQLSIPGGDRAGILDSERILALESVPKNIVVVGAGVAGVEMAGILNGLGARVSLVEVMPHILPTEDAELTSILEAEMKRSGVSILTGTTVNAVEGGAGNWRVLTSAGGKEKALEAEAVAVVVGNRPDTENLGLEECGVATVKGAVRTDSRMATSLPGVFAAGDVTGGIMLAYVAMEEGRTAAENALGMESHVELHAVPRCIFSMPELASVGLTETAAAAEGGTVLCGRSAFAANPMASILLRRKGLVKVVAEGGKGRVLGVHIIGPGAVSLIPEAALAVRCGLTVEDIARTLHPHPALSETLWEAVRNITDRMPHHPDK